MRNLLQRQGALPSPRPAVQIGGSKGKGTTCTMLAALARRAGLRVGCYVSPHVTTLLERLQVDGEEVPVAVLEQLLREILAVPAARAPSFFEAMTAAAAQWFAARAVDLALFEVGLGGRLDATTALPVDASILTTIELEHTELLGDSVAAIAREKAPILRPGGLGFTSAEGEALRELRAHAARVGARLLVLGCDFAIEGLREQPTGLAGVLRLPHARMPFVLHGGTQFDVPAFALAATCLETMRPGSLPAEMALDRPVAPCRFERLLHPHGVIVLDGAHTERSLQAVAVELARHYPGQRAAVLVGFAAGKRWREALSCLLPLVDSWLVTTVSGTVSEDPSAIAAHLHCRGAAAAVVDDVASGIAALQARGGVGLVVGSFYLAGEARRQLVAAGPADA